MPVARALYLAKISISDLDFEPAGATDEALEIAYHQVYDEGLIVVGYRAYGELHVVRTAASAATVPNDSFLRLGPRSS